MLSGCWWVCGFCAGWRVLVDSGSCYGSSGSQMLCKVFALLELELEKKCCYYKYGNDA